MGKVFKIILFSFLLIILSIDLVNARSGCCSWHGGVSEHVEMVNKFATMVRQVDLVLVKVGVVVIQLHQL